MRVEMYVGFDHQSEGHGTWSTQYVEIPSDTPESKVHAVAEEQALKDLKAMPEGDAVAFVGVYNIPPRGESCKKCDSDISESGYCEDETCPYSDHKQDETWTEG